MRISIRTKFLAICIVLVTGMAVGLSTAYYRLTTTEKRRESQERIQIAFDIIRADLHGRFARHQQRVAEFLQQNTRLPMTAYFYQQDAKKLASLQFIVSSLAKGAEELRYFGSMIGADRVAFYGADRRLLLAFQRQDGLERVGGFVMSAAGNDAYFPLDNFQQLTLMQAGNQPIPDLSLPEGLSAAYDREIPATMRAAIFQEDRRIGLRVIAPLLRGTSFVGVLVSDIWLVQELVDDYASLSKTDVNIFAGNALSVGTLRMLTTLRPADAPSAACEPFEEAGLAPTIRTITLDEKYYQGQCAFHHDGKPIGAIVVSLSRKTEQREIQRILTTVITLSGIGLAICAFVVSKILSPRFIGPILYLAQVSTDMANGNLSQTIRMARSDEFGLLAQGFMFMRDEIRKKIQEIQALNQQLAQSVQERTTELDALRDLLRQIGASALTVREASARMAGISAEMAVDAAETSRQVAQASSCSERISQSVGSVSDSTGQTAAMIQQISQNIEEVMNIIANAVSLANAAKVTIVQLEAYSEEIGTSSEGINFVAQQTNLLALNATIESARAGEAGQGFTVVAREVKDLARQSARLADDITKKIATIQHSAEETTTAMSQVVTIIHHIEELVKTIAPAITQQSAIIHEISGSMLDAARGSKDITNSMSNVAVTSQKSSELAARVQQGAQELSSVAAHLQQLVETFHQK